MAKHFYHIPLQDTLAYIKTDKLSLQKLTQDTKALEYAKQLGRSYYMLEIERFIHFFKIDKELDYALKTLEYFNSTYYMTQMYKVLNFAQFALPEHQVEQKAFFYGFCYYYHSYNKESFSLFMQKSFLYHHASFTQASNIEVNHQTLSHALAKNRKQTIKASFGEEGEASFFTLFLDGVEVIHERGKRIKTLRKKAYKRLFYLLLEA